jgi:hypothetical protein
VVRFGCSRCRERSAAQPPREPARISQANGTPEAAVAAIRQNWVKVVQRLPVLPRDGEPPLRAGMTATLTIGLGHRRSLADLFRRTASAADTR